MSLARVTFFSISLDGFGTGEGQSLETPFGHAGERLHEWLFETRWWHASTGQAGGSGGIHDALVRQDEPGGGGGSEGAFVRQHDPGVGAEIMGSRKFGPPDWPEHPDWKGWWGPDPPF